MAMFQYRSASEQVVDFLKNEIAAGRWGAAMPGGDRLSKELGVGKATIEAALSALEKQGCLKPGGRGRKRQIVRPDARAEPALRIKMLLYEPNDAFDIHIQKVRREIGLAGHQLTVVTKTLKELRQDPVRVAELVASEPRSAWIVVAAARPVIEWFAEAELPAFALFGMITGLSIAGGGPNKRSALEHSLKHLMDAGHSRIVMLTREERRKPEYGPSEQLFLDLLEARGIRAGSYNIPDWEESAGGLARCLDELFRFTPPTVVYISDTNLYLAVTKYLARHHKDLFRKTVLVCSDYHPSFEWCAPAASHFWWDEKVLIRRTLQWANNIASGKDDRRQVFIPSRFVAGEAFESA